MFAACLGPYLFVDRVDTEVRRSIDHEVSGHSGLDGERTGRVTKVISYREAICIIGIEFNGKRRGPWPSQTFAAISATASKL